MSEKNDEQNEPEDVKMAEVKLNHIEIRPDVVTVWKDGIPTKYFRPKVSLPLIERGG
jgi:hypothetical protein